MMVQEEIGPLCHKYLAFNVNEAFIVFVFIAMCFAPGFLRVCRPGLERFAFVISKVLLSVNVYRIKRRNNTYLFDQFWNFDDL
jgi:hypothetical protein